MRATRRGILLGAGAAGGLLVACHPDSVDQVLATFRNQGFEQAAVVGRVMDGPARLAVEN